MCSTIGLLVDCASCGGNMKLEERQGLSFSEDAILRDASDMIAGLEEFLAGK